MGLFTPKLERLLTVKLTLVMYVKQQIIIFFLEVKV